MSTCCFIAVSFQIRGSSLLGYIAQRRPAKDSPRPVEFSRDITARVPATAPPPRQPAAVTSLPTPTCCASHRRNPVVPRVAPTLLSDAAEPRPQNPRGTEGAHGADRKTRRDVQERRDLRRRLVLPAGARPITPARARCCHGPRYRLREGNVPGAVCPSVRSGRHRGAGVRLSRVWRERRRTAAARRSPRSDGGLPQRSHLAVLAVRDRC